MLLRGPEPPFHLLLHLRVGVPEGRKRYKRTAEGQPAGDPERLLDMGIDLSAQLLRTLRRRAQHEERLIRRQVQRFHVQLQDAAQALIKYEGIVLQKVAVKIHKDHGPKPLQAGQGQPAPPSRGQSFPKWKAEARTEAGRSASHPAPCANAASSSSCPISPSRLLFRSSGPPASGYSLPHRASARYVRIQNRHSC